MTATLGRRAALGVAAAALCSSGAPGQPGWPTRAVRMVVPFPPGGLADSVARPLAARLTTVFGQPFIIDNRPGAGGNLGAEQVAKSEPDGHTLLVGSLGPLAVNAWLFPSLPFDPRAFAPVSLLIETPKVVAVNPSRPWRGLEELTAAARAAPGRLSAGSAGNGSSLHIALELYKRAAGVDVIHVPYRGAAAAITDLVGGRLDFVIDNVPNILSQIRAGAVRPLATATEARLPQLPDVPTTAEAGLPALRFSTWFGLVAPPGTPAAVTERLSAAVAAALRDPDIGGRLAEQGAVPGGGTPEAFGRFMEAERAKLEPVVHGSGMRAD
ncbi:MAG: tripartite tricarboxylate transporter substrate binding protein [Acetobacteraceae bacterium]|nr:tripartite tricarboxylate transporter substrate binding protein [Acetobacteraceae bacterium]